MFFFALWVLLNKLIDNYDSGYLRMASTSVYKLIRDITISWPRRNRAKN